MRRDGGEVEPGEVGAVGLQVGGLGGGQGESVDDEGGLGQLFEHVGHTLRGVVGQQGGRRDRRGCAGRGFPLQLGQRNRAGVEWVQGAGGEGDRVAAPDV